MSSAVSFLFGGSVPWNASLWTASDDTVRGGASFSFLEVPTPDWAHFYGYLDSEKLGNSGFASQRTVGDLALDLSEYEGLVVSISLGDSKNYTLNLYDSLPTGSESSLIWELDFAGEEGKDVYMKWDDFVPTYRGTQQNDTAPLNLKDIKRISLMMRSFFGQQEGNFSLGLSSIAATKDIPSSKRLAKL